MEEGQKRRKAKKSCQACKASKKTSERASRLRRFLSAGINLNGTSARFPFLSSFNIAAAYTISLARRARRKIYIDIIVRPERAHTGHPVRPRRFLHLRLPLIPDGILGTRSIRQRSPSDFSVLLFAGYWPARINPDEDLALWSSSRVITILFAFTVAYSIEI